MLFSKLPIPPPYLRHPHHLWTTTRRACPLLLSVSSAPSVDQKVAGLPAPSHLCHLRHLWTKKWRACPPPPICVICAICGPKSGGPARPLPSVSSAPSVDQKVADLPAPSHLCHLRHLWTKKWRTCPPPPICVICAICGPKSGGPARPLPSVSSAPSVDQKVGPARPLPSVSSAPSVDHPYPNAIVNTAPCGTFGA
jgi:hypothetical protein